MSGSRSSSGGSKRYPSELKARAVRMVAEIRADHESECAAMTRVAQPLDVKTPETVRQWVRQAEVDEGTRAGTNAELKRANAILKAAAAFFGAELDRPSR